MFEQATCTETISIVRAILFGADGACVNIGMESILGGVVLFVVAVVLLRFVGAWTIRRLFPSLRKKAHVTDMPPALPEDTTLQQMPYESPIRSTGAWGSKPR